ncbi:uroporphyrinogen-III C-methyltransferase [Spirulina major CS-329]|uniref:uroporphyrinogen-III C-methyltransferase n=1 Tax=Spirulina TaxID=1154 RepID=UPI00233008AD|nr:MULTISPECIES: uroporphyrinogen-III C-methyltransferase [Spirulina]MDB9495657.1 uroporphyrinogen-III C-methyltransferase [Spirulina subsalsa CS-330]MDB9501481.1 uroporphyrinogen-III C-methyltransferase [Spirulina major CS-329]
MPILPGQVYLVGAGVNCATLTQQAVSVLRRADIVIHDGLIDPRILTATRPDCLCLEVGKRGGEASTPQAQINQMLIAYCQQGKQVVRLKSGDPGVFGRSHPELEALTAAACPWQLVPGVSSALAAPLLAGILLTDKVLSQGFAVMTAHDLDGLAWGALAQLETLVFLMGGRNLAGIVERLIAAGRSPSGAIAVIRHGGQPQQQVWRGTCADILEQTAGQRLSPCVIVIGEVVTMQQNPVNPLAGQRIVVTRSAEQASVFRDLLEQQGAQVIDLPALEIRPPSSWAVLDGAIATLSRVDWLLLTSANAVNAFFDRLAHHQLDSRALGHCKIAVVGRKTAKVLQAYHLTADFIPPDYVADAMVTHFPDRLADKTLLFPRVETGGRDVLVQEFQAQGATVIEAPAYESGCPATIPLAARHRLAAGEVDMITFASSKTVQNVHTLIQSVPGWEALMQRVTLASIGPQTSQACDRIFGRVDIEAQDYTLEGLAQAIRLHYATP